MCEGPGGGVSRQPSTVSHRPMSLLFSPLKIRDRFVLDVTDAVRRAWPERLPLFVRISATDWSEEGWSIEDSIALAKRLKQHGADVIDCSSGGNLPHAKIPVAPGYQVPFAERIRREAGIMTAAVGMITAAARAEQILHLGQADAVILARQLLRDPYWPVHAALELGAPIQPPVQYLRAFPRA